MDYKVFKWVLLLVLFFYIFAYLAQFFAHENLNVNLINETSKSKIRVKVWLDSDLIYQDSVSHIVPVSIPLKKSLGMHQVLVYRYDTDQVKKDKINLVYLKWVEFRIKSRPDTILKSEHLQPQSYF